MNALRASLGFLAAAVVLVLPAAAPAEPVPPGNSAATQYTEAFPAAGGPHDAERGQKGNRRRPAQVLGHRNVRRLESQGVTGREVAAIAAETAPSQGAARSAGAGHRSQGADGSAGGGNVPGQPSDKRPGSSGGGSGLGEVIRQASGSSSSDGTGLLLPLAIVGAIIWSSAYLIRQRKNPTE